MAVFHRFLQSVTQGENARAELNSHNYLFYLPF